jgi:glycosyltransferase involved in cell wall biosynthesis
MLLPYGSKRRTAAKRFLKKTGVMGRKVDAYEYWSDNILPTLESLPRELLKTDPQPLISIVVPAYNPPGSIFRLLVDSVINQTYQNWELVIADASSNKVSGALIKSSARIDSRIKVFQIENLGISANTNQAIERSKGEYIAFLDHDDTLAPHALQTMASHIASNPTAKLYYSDEDKVSHDNKKYSNPHFKPSFSPDLLNNVNYITHLVVVERQLANLMKGLRAECDGAQDYDFILRAIDNGASPQHVPGVLYHWRKTKRSTAENFSNKKNVLEAGVKAVQDHFERNKSPAKVSPIDNRPGFYKVSYAHLKQKADIALVVPGCQDPRDSQVALKALLHNTNLDDIAEIVVPSLDHLPEQFATKLHIIETKINPRQDYRAFLDSLMKQSKSQKYVFVHDSLAPHDQEWLHEISWLLEEKHIFSVAPRVINEDNGVVDMGLIKSCNGSYHYLFCRLKGSEDTMFGQTEWVRNVSALSGRVFGIKKTNLEKYLKDSNFGGNFFFDPSFFEQASSLGLYNTVWSYVNLQKIWYPALGSSQDPFFNADLCQYHGDIHPYGTCLPEELESY